MSDLPPGEDSPLGDVVRPKTMVQRRNRRRVGRRLVWYKEPPTDQYWFEMWSRNIDDAHYVRARQPSYAKNPIVAMAIEHFPKDGHYLEAGCGTGFHVAGLRGLGYDVEGVDYSEKLVAMINDVAPDLPVRAGDCLALDCPDNTYDGYLSYGVVEHREEGPEPFMAEAFRVVKPGGLALFSVPAFGPVRKLVSLRERGPAPTEPFFQYGFSKTEFVQFMVDAGFTIEVARFEHPHRLLQEELGWYSWLSHRRKGLGLAKLSQMLTRGHDGHMLSVIGRKPAS